MTREPQSGEARRKRGRRQFIGVCAVFVIPLAGAWIGFANIDAWKPSSGTNNGELIAPAWPLKDPVLRTVQGESLGGEALERTWTLVHVVADACSADCERNLYHTRQIRVALGKDIQRVKRLLLVSAPEALGNAEAIQREHPDLMIAASDSLTGQITSATSAMTSQSDSIYLVDPLLNLMMRFPPDLNPRLIIKDLKKLLKVSRIG